MQAESLILILEAVEQQMLESIIQEDLSISEIVSLYIIDRMNRPTILEFANRVHISQSNATYIIRKLINKGYLIKRQHPDDKREYHLITTSKFSESIDYNNNAMIPRLLEEVLPHLEGGDQREVGIILNSMEDLKTRPAA